jgi:hypothetical protein
VISGPAVKLVANNNDDGGGSFYCGLLTSFM